jgi:subfamily B ATP-binding cassette protein MsbA
MHYRLRIAVVMASIVLFSIFEVLPLALIEPLADNHLGKNEGNVSSRELMVHLSDGQIRPLLEYLPQPEYLAWMNDYPGFRSIFISENRDAPRVKLDTYGLVIPATGVLIPVESLSLMGQTEWKTLEQLEPELAGKIQSFNRHAPEFKPAPLWIYALIVPILYFIKGIFGVLRHVILAWVALNVVRDIQNDLYTRILTQPVSFFRHSRTGDLISRLVNDVTVLSSQVVGVLQDLIQSPFQIVAAVTMSFLIDWQLALTFFIVIPLLAVPMQIMGRQIRKASRRAQEKRADISSVLVETLTGVEVVKAFNMEVYENNRYGVETKSLLRREMRIRKARAYSSPVTEQIAAFGISAVILIAMWRMSQDPRVGIGTLASIAGLITATVKPIDRFWKARFQMVEMAEAGKRIFEVMDREPEIKDAPDAIPLPPDWKEIRFEDVAFAYGNEPVLSKVSFTVKRGEKIALVGKTGAGKTSLVNLLARFYDVTDGKILFDGVDIRQVTLSSLLDQIGIVTQRNVLFNDTVAKNIAYGRQDISFEQIQNAARAAYADEFISEMKEGYETIIGEMGTRLSGGQAQRMAIARAIFKNPPILILDEATASLDTASEQLVQNALDRLMTNRTTFAIAHRLSTIANADRILVLKEGRIVEAGAHADLYPLGGEYTRLCDAQFGRNEVQ